MSLPCYFCGRPSTHMRDCGNAGIFPWCDRAPDCEEFTFPDRPVVPVVDAVFDCTPVQTCYYPVSELNDPIERVRLGAVDLYRVVKSLFRRLGNWYSTNKRAIVWP